MVHGASRVGVALVDALCGTPLTDGLDELASAAHQLQGKLGFAAAWCAAHLVCKHYVMCQSLGMLVRRGLSGYHC
jgi:hypothetical protein